MNKKLSIIFIAVLFHLGLTSVLAQVSCPDNDNPIAALIADSSNSIDGEIVTCPDDGSLLPRLFLCGASDSDALSVTFSNTSGITWELLDETSCSSAASDCANKNAQCTWSAVGNGANYIAQDAGKYRISVNYQNGCFERFYFDVFKNPLAPQTDVKDIMCGNPGEITVTNVPANYEFQLLDDATGNILVPYSANNGPLFPINNEGTYAVEIRQSGVSGGCVFRLDKLDIRTRNFQVQTSVTDAVCGDFGSISVDVLDADPQYYFNLRELGYSLDDYIPTSESSYTFEGLRGGDYELEVWTDDGCYYTEQLQVQSGSPYEVNAVISQHITCREGNIQMQTNGTPKGGVSYAIWSYEDKDGNLVTSYPTVNDIPNSEFQTSVIFDIVDEGIYTFVAIDKANCAVVTNKVRIELFPSVDYTFTETDETCFGNADGRIDYTIIDDNGFNVEFRLEYPDGTTLLSTSGVFTNLPQGDYIVYLVQAKGGGECEFPQDHTIAGPDAEITADVVMTQSFTCDQDAILEVQNAVGGTAPYTYSLDGVNFSGSAAFNGLQDGTYTISVRDAQGCAYTLSPFTIDPTSGPQDIDFSASVQTCADPDPDVTLNVTGGNGSLKFEIIAPASAVIDNGNNNVFSDLSAGTYTFRVTDSQNCSYQENFTISPVTPIAADGSLVNPVSCVGAADGAITFAINGFSGTYSYTLTGGSSAAGISLAQLDFTGLSAGDYTLTVTDENTLCTASATITVPEPANVLAANLNVSPITCASDGSVSVSSSGGWGSYSYTLLQPDGTPLGPQAVNSFDNLTQTGTYNLTVTDANGCSTAENFDLSSPDIPVVNLVPTHGDLCYDPSSGMSLTASASGGLPPYSYSINGGPTQSSEVFDGLTPGNYTVEVYDSYNCSASSASLTVAPQLTISTSVVKELDCSASPEAVINVTINGGYPGFTYQVNSGGSTAIAGNSFSYSTASPGTFIFEVTDQQGCTISSSVTISADDPLTAVHNTSDPTCHGESDGWVEIVVDADTGTPPYQINFDGNGFSSQTVYTNLADQTYSYTVRDDKGCEFTDSFTLVEPAKIDADAVIVQDLRCDMDATIEVQNLSGGTAPFQFSIDAVNYGPSSTFNGLTAGKYRIFIMDANGCYFETNELDIKEPDGPDRLHVNNNPEISCPSETADVRLHVHGGEAPYMFDLISPSSTPADLVDDDEGWFYDLPAGSYRAMVTDANGCTFEEDFTLAPLNKIQVSGQVTSNVSCFGGSDGAATFSISNFDDKYHYSFNGAALVTDENAPEVVFTGLMAGNHVLEVTDKKTNCVITETVIISQPNTSLDFTFMATPKTCAEGASVNLSASGGWGTYSYELILPDGSSTGLQSSGYFTDLTQEGDYDLRAYDQEGCMVEKQHTVSPPAAPVATVDLTASQLCYSSTAGADVTIAVSGGTAPYVYQLRRDAGAWTATKTTNTFSDLVPGNYEFRVIDSGGCEDVVSITIAGELTANATLLKDNDCSASPDAVIDLATNAGYGPYTYEINFNGGGYVPVCDCFPYTTSTAGTYQFRVTDSQGCVGESNIVTVSPAVSPQATETVIDASCFGNSDGIVEIIIDTSFGSAPYQVDFNGGGYSSQTVYSGLSVGTYNYTVVDDKGCTFTGSATVAEPDDFLADVIPTNVSCDPGGSGDILGRIDIDISSGGVGDLYFTLYDNQNNIVNTAGPLTNSDHVTFNNLDFGDYYVRIVDQNGCEYYEDPVRILASPFLSLNTVTTADCLSGGTATLTADGGSGDYDFWIYGTATGPDTETVLSPTSEQAVFNGLNPGQTYFIQAVDNSNGCNSYVEVVVPTVSSIDVVSEPLVEDYSCNAAMDGSITFQVENYDAAVSNIQYTLMEAITNNPVAGYTGTVPTKADDSPTDPVTLSGLNAGDYVLLIEEVESPFCANVYEFRIIEPLPISLDILDQENANCNELANITVRAQGGEGGFQYAFVPAGNAASGYSSSAYAELDPAVSTDWDIWTRDAAGCEFGPTPVSVATDPGPMISSTVPNECTATEGNFTIEIQLDQAGIAPHTLSINGGAFQSTSLVNSGDIMNINNLSSGTYDLVVRDVNGCITATENVIIYTPSSLSAEVTEQPTCLGNDGQVLITPYGGSGVYTYELFDSSGLSVTGSPQISPLFTNLAAGVYDAYVYDGLGSGCDSKVSVELEIPTNVSFTASKEDVSCFGGSDGRISAVLDAGMDNPPYLYNLYDSSGLILLAGPQSNTSFSNLSAGDYIIEVISSRGCNALEAVTIDQPDDLVAGASATAFSCNADNAVNEAVITVTAVGGTAPYQYSRDGSNWFNANTFSIADNGTVQTIDVFVLDANGCSSTTSIDIDPLPNITDVSFTQVTPLTCANDEVLRLTVTGGSGEYLFEQLPLGSQTRSPGPGVFSADFNLPQPGDYQFQVTDLGTGCVFYTASYNVAVVDLIEVTSQATVPVSCYGVMDGELQFQVDNYTGNYTYQVFDIAGNPLTGVLIGDTSVNPRVVSGLPANMQFVEVIATDSPFCGTISNNVTIASPGAPLDLNLIANTNANCNFGAQVSVAATGGNQGYSYAFMPAGSIPAPADFGSDAIATLNPAVFPADYDIYVQDNKGCTHFITVTVNEDPLPTVTAPAFTSDQCTSDGSSYSFSVTGTGVTPLEYSIGNGYQASESFTVTAPGTYTVTVRDANGCTATDTLVIESPLAVSAAVGVQPSCSLNDGEIIVTATGGSNSYAFELFDSGMTPLAGPQPGNTFSGLSPGDYFVMVYDQSGSGCSRQTNVALETPTPVDFTLTKYDISCNGAADGRLEVDLAVTNDNPPYTFILDDGVNPPVSQDTRIFSALDAGTYTITVVSDRGCSDVQSFDIIEPAMLDVTATATAFTCNSDNNVTQSVVTISPSGGTLPYTYSLDGVSFTETDTFLVNDTGAVQHLNITLRDANGCEAAYPITLEPLNQFSAVVNQLSPIHCGGDEIVEVRVSDDGNPSNTYTFELLPVGNPDGAFISNPSNTVAEFSLAEVGNYVFRVTDDATGCSFTTAAYDIVPYDLIEATAVALTPIQCFGDTTGEIEIEVANYTGSYDYTLLDAMGNPTAVSGSGDTSSGPLRITGLAGGAYSVEIRATVHPFCDDITNTVTINAPESALNVSLSETANVQCTDDKGEILVQVSGGYAPYDIVLTHTADGTTYTRNASTAVTFGNLSAGTYSAQITDAQNCLTSMNITLDSPTPITAGISASATTLACFEEENASVTAINPQGGSGGYQFSLNYFDPGGALLFTSAPGPNPQFENLGAGTYSITVTDGWNCAVETTRVTIDQPTEVIGRLRQLSALSCTQDASLQLSAEGGNAPYEFSDDGISYVPFTSGNTQVFTFGPGSYTFYVRDANGCVSSLSNLVNVEALIPLTIDLDLSAATINCSGESTALLRTRASGGLGNYSYELYNDVALTSLIAGPQNSGDFSNLPAGSYFVRVQSGDCTEVSSEIVIAEPMPLQVDEASHTNISCSGSENGSITVSVSGGTGEIFYAISPNLDKFSRNNTFTGLAPGIYDVVAQDVNGCFIPFQFTITEPTPLEAFFTTLPEVCAGEEDGSISLSISGGTAPYRTAFNANDDNDFVNGQTEFNNLAAGTYVIFIRDAQDCETNVIVEVEGGVNLNAMISPVYKCSGPVPDNYLDILLEDETVSGDVMYALDSTDPADMQLEPDFRNIPAGDHYISISHANGCLRVIDFTIDAFEPLHIALEQNNLNEITAIASGGGGEYTFTFDGRNNGEKNTYFINRSDTYTVTVEDANGCTMSAEIAMEFIDIEIPNFFTPDGDGNNDLWIPRNLEGFPNTLIIIYDRYGREVYRMDNKNQGWDGFYKETEMPTGDYWYVIRLRGEDDPRKFVGHFTLYR
ncbi:T9SS type B sorting domain-containing protein [Zeaxanthinibacter sp. PT1]|uniref:T9SS type B sorting domain-containing protein n=1 Tax=Zeaxanthinibacter TaxID=561554 RepID=UPI00234A5A08|nr:T9SS type B sorting domain-containing protein [Zeaxanthinibacter sp. PT1]MDC6350648.1 T9SS type B sorting domain-containing protein [Zeaxanthinibacter sp. PT1]